MGLFTRNSEGGLMDVIRCDEPDYLIWKWRPQGQSANSTNKENSIRWNSSLRVKDGEVAIFVYRQKTGAMQDVIVGPYDEILKTENFPVLTNILGLAYAGGSPFQAEVYFINTAELIQIPFTVPYFSVFDPRFDDFSCPVAVRGRISFCIADYQAFIKLHRLINFDLEKFSEQVTAGIKKYAKSFIGNAPQRYGFPVVQIERYIAELSDAMLSVLTPEFLQDFGVTLKRVDLSAIDCDKESEEYKKLYKLTGKQKKKQVVFETDLGMVRQAFDAKNDLVDQKQRQKIEREGLRQRQRLQNETEHLQAHIIDSRLGGFFQKMGFGRSAANKQMISDVLTAKVMNDATPSSNSTNAAPDVSFFVAVNGEQKGPFDISTIKQMVQADMLNADTYVWKEGMAEWKHAVDTPELKPLFKIVPPPIPTK